MRGAIAWPQAEVCRTSVKKAHSFIHSRHSLGSPTKHEIICTFQVQKNRAWRPRQAVVYESPCAYSKPSLCRHRFFILALLEVFHGPTRSAVRKNIRAFSEVPLITEPLFSPPGLHRNERLLYVDLRRYGGRGGHNVSSYAPKTHRYSNREIR